MKPTTSEEFLAKGRPIQATLRDQIAISIEKPHFTFTNEPNVPGKTEENKVLAEWRERYRLADLIIKSCR